MLSRVRTRLTYANVVATLALFAAIGGSAYAVGEISSRDIKNRSIKRIDVRRNHLTGKEIAESSLRRVPSAQEALEATLAQTATLATTAQQAQQAAVAENAQALSGQSAAFFEKSSRSQFGRAPFAPAGSSAEQAVLSWPEMGVELRSATDQGACNAGELRVGVRNTKSSGPAVQAFDENSLGTVPAGATTRFCSEETDSNIDFKLTDSTGRTLFADCIVAMDELRCLGIRSEP
jgi:hypothetical protein